MHDAKYFAEAIQASLEKVVEKAERCDANVISDHHAGVQAFIQRTYKNAYFVQCYAHQPIFIVRISKFEYFFSI